MVATFTDARTINWPLCSPISMIFISFVYLCVVYFAGPQFMKNRKPYSLKTYMQCYNLFQIIANFWLVFNVIKDGKPFAAVWRYCEPFDKICDVNCEKVLELIWWGLLLKIIDLSETIIFVLRKKDRQISYFHVYHHLFTVIYVWLILRYLNHGVSMTAMMLNCSVHVIMYSYYFLSTFGSNGQQKLRPFKKSLTIIQMAHIAFMMTICAQGFRPNCVSFGQSWEKRTSQSETMAQLEFNYYPSEIVADARMINWLLLSSPIPMILISFVYLCVVYFAGPQFMKNRKPYSLKTYMQCYNLFQIIANFWLVFNVIKDGKPFAAVWRYCEPFDKICDVNCEKVLELFWWGLLLKIIDLSETIVFVLRKKDRQISYFHVYHHLFTVIHVWLTLRYLNHGVSMTAMMLNCSVHVIMYSYYFLSTFGSNVQRKLQPMKKLITIVQMTHIAFLMTVCAQGFRPNCGNKIVKYFSVVSFLNLIVNLLFFFNFYGSYKKSKTV